MVPTNVTSYCNIEISGIYSQLYANLKPLAHAAKHVSVAIDGMKFLPNISLYVFIIASTNLTLPSSDLLHTTIAEKNCNQKTLERSRHVINPGHETAVGDASSHQGFCILILTSGVAITSMRII